MVSFPTASESYQYVHGLYNIEIWMHELDHDFRDDARANQILSDLVAFASKPDPEGAFRYHS